jgi:hypothetical protein
MILLELLYPVVVMKFFISHYFLFFSLIPTVSY